MSAVRVPRAFVDEFERVARAQQWDAAAREEMRAACREDIKWRAWISMLADSYGKGYEQHPGNQFMTVDRWRLAVGLSSVQEFNDHYIQLHGSKHNEPSNHVAGHRPRRAHR